MEFDFKEWLIKYKGSPEQNRHKFFDLFVKEMKKIKYFDVRMWEGFRDRAHYEQCNADRNIADSSRVNFHGNFYLISVDDGLDLEGYYMLLDMNNLDLEIISNFSSNKTRLHDTLHKLFDDLCKKRFPVKMTGKKFGI